MKETVHPSAVQGRITAPASKSYAQRALAAALLVPDSDNPAGWSELRNMGLCNDTSAALDVVRRLGAEVRYGDNKGTYYVQGGFLKHKPEQLNIGESGLSARLFTPIAAQSPVPVTVTGHGSILRRPIVSAMAGPLQALGASVDGSEGGFLPVTVRGPLRGGTVEVDGSLSSQFITGLLMTAPLSAADTKIVVHSPKSVPYLAMTLEVLKAFGIRASHQADYTEFIVPGGQQYQATLYNIEGDWSGASCILVAGAVASPVGGRGVTVDNLNPRSLQADRAIVEALTRAGASMDFCGHVLTVRRSEHLRAFEFDATDCPDLFPALAALAAFCEGTTLLKGTKRLTHKESDRAATIAAEFAKLGVEIDLSELDVMAVRGVAGAALAVKDVLLDSHNDHRIAMATSVAALRADRPVVVEGAEAVDKSYPCFWDDLRSLCLK